MMDNIKGANMFVSRFAMFLVVLTAGIQGIARADITGSKDHPLLPRFAGSQIIGYSAKDYDGFTLGLGKAYEASSSNYKLKNDKRIEGQVTRILYLAPAGKTALQVFRNYEKSLKRTGSKTMFTCSGNSGCGWHSWFTGAQTLGGLREYALQLGDDYHYLASHLTRKEGDVYVSLLAYKYDSSVISKWEGRTMVELNIIEIEPMEEEMVRITAEDLAKGIAEEGHAAIRQIYFDTDSDTIKPESRDAIEQIARLLKNEPGLKIIVVGHTDHQGELQYNMNLSQRRAKAVMTALETEFGIDRERLGAAGLGYLAPVASNRSEKGRAKNRRVEIIEQ